MLGAYPSRYCIYVKAKQACICIIKRAWHVYAVFDAAQIEFCEHADMYTDASDAFERAPPDDGADVAACGDCDM
jgi:hypothetical protein